MTNIDLSEIIDITDLEQLAEDAVEIIEDEDGGFEAEIEAAKHDLAYLSAFVAELGYEGHVTGKEIAGALRSISDRQGPYMVRGDYFEDHARETAESLGHIPSDLPEYIENNIDWAGVAEDLKADYSKVTLADTVYYLHD